MIDSKIKALNLDDLAEAAAVKLKATHPEVVFTSGRRTRFQQAEAMASNVVKFRGWIDATYRLSEASHACQVAVDSLPATATEGQITNALYLTLLKFSDEQLTHLSKHLSGEAFDVQPVKGPLGAAIQETVKNLPGLKKFLTNEGGLVRWHAEF